MPELDAGEMVLTGGDVVEVKDKPLSPEERLLRAIFGEGVGVSRCLSEVDSISLSQAIDIAVSTLALREIEIIRMRFGFKGKARTLREVAPLFGLTKERIRQIEAKALRKLRHPSRSRRLRGYLI